ncbi:MAG: DMT family transporter [Rubrimonas sp.]|uniref:DMT family transporter n=1 Tax=Rubrimonas sp. TaxID=2036015 RepID=UPI002FDCA360
MPALSTLSPNLRGALWMLASVLGATGMTVFVRMLSDEMHTAMIAFLRSAAGLLFLAPLLLRADGGRGALTMRRPSAHLLRGALIAAALNMGFYAIWKLPIAIATILFFLAPIFSTALAPSMAGEKVGPRRWAAVLAGFLGALIVLRPGLAPFEPAMLAALGSSLCFALALMIGKRLSAEDGSDAVFATSALLTAALTLPPALLAWEVPQALWLWGLVLALAAMSSLRGYADIRAFAVGEASVVAPVSYLRLPAVAVAGWLMFGETLDLWGLVGGAVIVGATLYIMLRERSAARASGARAAGVAAP